MSNLTSLTSLRLAYCPNVTSEGLQTPSSLTALSSRSQSLPARGAALQRWVGWLCCAVHHFTAERSFTERCVVVLRNLNRRARPLGNKDALHRLIYGPVESYYPRTLYD